MTDICFIYLPHPYLKRPDAQLPMGILMLAAVIKKDGRYSVEVKDYSSYTFADAVIDLPEAKIYGITVTSMEIPDANAFATHIKVKYPESHVVLGGPGTVAPQLIDWEFVNSAVTGEAEITIFNVIENVMNNVTSTNTVYKGEPTINLNDLPFPAREMLEGPIGGDVFAYGKNYVGEGSTAILSSRGCPFNCAFCASPALSYGVRYRSSKSIADEIMSVIKDYGIHQFRFSDDMFPANRNRLIEICDLLGVLGIAWRASIRTNPLDKDMLTVMRDSGCKEISFGAESFDDDVLRLLNKKATVDNNIRALEMTDEVGIDARILVMIGTPGQTKETIEYNKFWISRLPHRIVACTMFVPMPGSDVWYNPDKYGIEILSKDMRDYNFYFFGPDGVNDLKPVIKLKDRPLDEFLAETIQFRQWLLEREDVNRG